jgi:hypothetical protein
VTATPDVTLGEHMHQHAARARRRPVSKRNLRLAQRVLSRVLDLGYPVTGAYLSGSVQVGLGNPTSDVDVVAVVDGDKRKDGRHVDPIISIVDGDTVLHVDVVPIDGLRATIDTFATFDLSEANIQLRAPKVLGILRDLGRFQLGRDLLPSRAVEQLRARIDPTAVRQMTLAALGAVTSHLVRDAAGAAMAGDWTTSLDVAKRVARYAGEALLANEGDVYISDKFLFHRLLRNPRTRDEGERLWDLLNAPAPLAANVARVERLAVSLLHIANGIIGACLLDGWDRVARPVDVVPVKATSRGVKRSPFVMPVRTVEGIALVGDTEARFQRVEAARLWLLLDGSPRRDVVGRFVDATGMEPGLAARFVEQNVRALDELGLVV